MRDAELLEGGQVLGDLEGTEEETRKDLLALVSHVISMLDGQFATGLKAKQTGVGKGAPPLDVPRTLYQLTEFLRVGCGHDGDCVYDGCH